MNTLEDNTLNRVVKHLVDLADTMYFNQHKYRFDPFAKDLHKQYLTHIDAIQKELAK